MVIKVCFFVLPILCCESCRHLSVHRSIARESVVWDLILSRLLRQSRFLRLDSVRKVLRYGRLRLHGAGTGCITSWVLVLLLAIVVALVTLAVLVALAVSLVFVVLVVLVVLVDILRFIRARWVVPCSITFNPKRDGNTRFVSPRGSEQLISLSNICSSRARNSLTTKKFMRSDTACRLSSSAVDSRYWSIFENKNRSTRP